MIAINRADLMSAPLPPSPSAFCVFAAPRLCKLTSGSHIDFKKLNIKLFLKNRAVDPHSLIAEPDPAVLLLLNADPDQLY